MPNRKSASTSDAKQLAKLLRMHFKTLTEMSFVGSLEECLERHLDFFVDLYRLDKYPTETNLKEAIGAVWPTLKMPAMAMAKNIKGTLGSLHYKGRRLTTGKKTDAITKRFFEIVGGEDSDVHAPKLPVVDEKPLLQPGCKKARVQEKIEQSSSSSTAKGTSQSSSAHPVTSQSFASIAAMYGLASASLPTPADELLLSQITVTSGCSDMLEKAGTTTVGTYWDHADCCLVKVSNDGAQTEKSVMKPGKDGFAEAHFGNNDIVCTDIPNLEIFPTRNAVLKKPAKAEKKVVMKKPAKKQEIAESEGEMAKEIAESDGEMAKEIAESDGEMADGTAESEHERAISEVAAKPAKANLFQWPDGTKMKLGLFTGQSYITTKSKLQLKFKLLVCCSKDRAARNGKDHHLVMQNLWEHFKSQPTLPAKADCKVLLDDSLSSL
jgi:hypothetical protein